MQKKTVYLNWNKRFLAGIALLSSGGFSNAVVAEDLPECSTKLEYEGRPIIVKLERSIHDKKGVRVASKVQWPLKVVKLNYILPELKILNPRYMFIVERGGALSGDFSYAKFRLEMAGEMRDVFPKPTGCSFYMGGVQMQQYIDGNRIAQPVQMKGVEDPLIDNLSCSVGVNSGGKEAFNIYQKATEIKLRLHDAYDKDVLNITFSSKWPSDLDQKMEGTITWLNKSHIDGKCVPITTGSITGGTGGCFLTTSVCDVVGLTDNCWELITLRRFRDNWLTKQPGGRHDIEMYYRVAPSICTHLSQSEEGRQKLLKLYWKRIIPCAITASIGLNKLTRRWYTNMMAELDSEDCYAILSKKERLS